VIRVPQSIYNIGLLVSCFIAILKVLSENRKKRIDVIHAVDSGYSGLAGLAIAKLSGIPLVYSVHSHRRFLLSRYLRGISGWFLASFDFTIEHLVYDLSNRIVVVSPDLKDYVISFHVSTEKINQIPVAIDLTKYKKSISEENYPSLGIDKKGLTIGYIGRLEPEKNLFTLIEAFEDLTKIIPKACLILIGDGSLAGSLKKEVENTQLTDKVRFLGPQMDVPLWLTIIDIFVLPSFTEGMPISLLEAMASGKAIIASDTAGIRKMVSNRKTAVLFDPHSRQQLTDSMLLLSRNPLLRKSLGGLAQNEAQQYSYDSVFPQLLRIYKDCQI
jgi:glycosyltransferase involved in cell wall biosynthesis